VLHLHRLQGGCSPCQQIVGGLPAALAADIGALVSGGLGRWVDPNGCWLTLKERAVIASCKMVMLAICRGRGDSEEAGEDDGNEM
jgi:hypothetical protein